MLVTHVLYEYYGQACQTVPDGTRRCQTAPEGARRCQDNCIQPDFILLPYIEYIGTVHVGNVRFICVLRPSVPHGARRCEAVLDGTRRYQTVPDGTRR